MICVVRISGQVGLNRDVVETLNRLRLRRKYSCVVLNPTTEQLGMINKVKDHVAFGEIDDKTFENLVKNRGQSVKKDKKVDAKKVVESILKGKKYSEIEMKPFFRLHPPRGGIDSKIHYPKGVLGNHKDKINELIERML